MNSNEISEFATKEDVKNLELTMRAGFETCAYMLNCILLDSAQAHGGISAELTRVAADKTEKQFNAMFEECKAKLTRE